MLQNLHTHTPRCRHAKGREEEYVQAAIGGGLQELGFSDHTPYWFHRNYYSTMRMYPQELPEYCRTVRELQVQYAPQIQIHLGLEVEYYPAYFEELMLQLRDQGVEYLLLGQHWVGNEIDEPYCGHPTPREDLLARYCDQTIQAMETGRFTYLAHPDLLHFTGDETVYRTHMQRLCRAAKACDMPLEINLLGILGNRHYPDLRFWQVAAQENCSVVIGADAHEPWAVCNPVCEAKALEMIQTYGLRLLERAPLRKL